jgi:hypothetical protein
MRVVLILEDALHDKLIAVPVISALCQYRFKRPVTVIADQERMGGEASARQPARLASVLNRYPTADVFLLLIDRDCHAPGRQYGGDRAAALRLLETEMQGRLPYPQRQRFIAHLAVEELEVWALAAQPQLPYLWANVRDHCHPKEEFFFPLSQQAGLLRTADQGRATLMQNAERRYLSIRTKCHELQTLEERLFPVAA